MNKNIILYSVPELNKVKGGPRTRISKFSEIILKNKENYFVEGKAFKKLKKTLKVKKTDILYIESSTNRLKLIDVICLLILIRKVNFVVTYIRDVYIQLFPENYKYLRGKITKKANKLSNEFYARISDKLSFPTKEMGEVFFSTQKVKKENFSLPPGSYIPKYSKRNLEMKCSEKGLKFLYLGSTKYKNSGFDDFIKIANSFRGLHTFYVLTADDISAKLREFDLKNVVKVDFLKHDEVIEFVYSKNISFIIHPRPRNIYDDITYPIKIMDCISLAVPFISLRHKPIVSLLPDNYPYFIEDFTVDAIDKIVNKPKELFEKEYAKTKSDLLRIRDLCLYKNQLEKLIENCK